MAEAIASIVGITHFGGELAHALYKLGVNIASARRQTNKIPERLTDYTTILDILEVILEGGEHCFSKKAEQTIKKHCDRSRDLFYEIEDLLPRQKHGWGKDELGWVDKVKWNFRKSRIALLVGELEYVKSDVVLLLMTQMLGQKIRSYRKGKRKSSKPQQEKEDDDVQRQTTKANNAILQHVNATETLSKLQEEADEESTHTNDRSSELALASQASSALTLVARQNEVVANFQQAMAKVEDPSERQALVMKKSPTLLQDLLLQWTTIDTPTKDKDRTLGDMSSPDGNDAATAAQEGSRRILAEKAAERAQSEAERYRAELEQITLVSWDSQSESDEDKKHMDKALAAIDLDADRRPSLYEVSDWNSHGYSDKGNGYDGAGRPSKVSECPVRKCDKKKDKAFSTKDLLATHLARQHAMGIGNIAAYVFPRKTTTVAATDNEELDYRGPFGCPHCQPLSHEANPFPTMADPSSISTCTNTTRIMTIPKTLIATTTPKDLIVCSTLENVTCSLSKNARPITTIT